MPAIATNTAALSTLTYLNENSSNQADNLARIASGSRITKAMDDASGLAIGTQLSADVAIQTQAKTNTANGISILSVADGGMSSISDILERMASITAQSMSGTVSDTERAFIQDELGALMNEITAIATATAFNGVSLLDGDTAYFTGVTFLAGTEATDTLTVTIDDVDSAALSLDAATVLVTGTDAERATAMTAITTAIGTVSAARADVGAQMSRFEFRDSMLAVSIENTSAATSSIMDADIAAEQTDLASNKVLTQAAIAALSQANSLPEDLLDLLR